MSELDAPELPAKARGVTYDPYQNKTMVFRDDGTPYTGGQFAYFTPAQKMLVGD